MEPKVAVVLAADLPADALPGDVARAVTGLFLAVDILDATTEGPESSLIGGSGVVLLGDQLLPLELLGELCLYLDGELVAAESAAELGDPVTRVAWLSSEVEGLQAGDAVLLGSPADSVPATPGTLLLEGPLGSMLSANLRCAA
ncbi:hypothetical protein C5613_41175 [Rhodococcus opacus]|uniref:2-keto-4-pentenoate hydratase n=1 Tax=Rhodococcus opacus TaxID=37919 RepID=A0A2S8IHG9_RHOOP|nr:hypothetical protein C5613_41175 [Rhodococcus opacus]